MPPPPRTISPSPHSSAVGLGILPFDRQEPPLFCRWIGRRRCAPARTLPRYRRDNAIFWLAFLPQGSCSTPFGRPRGMSPRPRALVVPKKRQRVWTCAARQGVVSWHIVPTAARWHRSHLVPCYYAWTTTTTRMTAPVFGRTEMQATVADRRQCSIAWLDSL